MMTVNMKKTVLVLSTLLMMVLFGCEVIDENLGSSALQTGTGPQGPKAIVNKLPQGEKFVLHSALGLINMCLDLPNGNTTNGTNVQLYYCNGAVAQTWILGSDGYIHYGGNYNKCLDAEGPSSANGTAIQIWDCKPGLANQQWTEVLDDYTIRTKQDISKCIDVDHANPAPGTKIQLWDCNDTTAQQWSAKVEIYEGKIRSTLVTEAEGDKCLYLPNGNTANGTALQLYSCINVGTQQWRLEDDGHIHYSGDHHKCLDARGPSSANGTIIQLWDCIPGQANQVWIIDHDKGTVRTSQNPGQCIDVKGGSTANYTPIQLWDCNGTAAQHWSLPNVRPTHYTPALAPTCGSCNIDWVMWKANIKLSSVMDQYGKQVTVAHQYNNSTTGVRTRLSGDKTPKLVFEYRDDSGKYVTVEQKLIETSDTSNTINAKDLWWWTNIGYTGATALTASPPPTSTAPKLPLRPTPINGDYHNIYVKIVIPGGGGWQAGMPDWEARIPWKQ